MHFNDILTRENVDLKGVMVLRHRPKEPQLRAVLPWLANENHAVFNAYQQTQGPIVEKAMTRAKFVASFIGHRPGQALFVGLYEMRGSKTLSFQQFWKIPENVELKKLGMLGMTDTSSSQLWFDLVPLKFRSEWKGKLVVEWPGKELSWWRWAESNEFRIHSIFEDSILVREMPDWTQLTLGWNQIELLPQKWITTLSQWRGVYFILDVSDGKGYVGAAYGEDNLFGRWRNYAKSGHGGNKLLRTRKPENLRFSILQRVSPDMESSDVQELEATWKVRLHSREFGLNDN